MYISGTVDFGRKTDADGTILEPGIGSGNYKRASLSGQTNGFKDYVNPVQDIYIAGYPEGSAVSLVVNGNIACRYNDSEDEFIWIWADAEAHYKSSNQFAVLGNGVTNIENTLKVFRNARPDAVTDNGTDTYLFGTAEGEMAGYVYWNGVKGSRKVILRKVNDSYAPLDNAKFTICRGNSDEPYVIKHEDGSTEPLKDLESTPSGVFWIGMLPYGTYRIIETQAPPGYNLGEFTLTVDENGVGYQTVDPTDPSKVSYSNMLNPIG